MLMTWWGCHLNIIETDNLKDISVNDDVSVSGSDTDESDVGEYDFDENVLNVPDVVSRMNLVSRQNEGDISHNLVREQVQDKDANKDTTIASLPMGIRRARG